MRGPAVRSHAVQEGIAHLPHVKNTLIIHSAKGGVGKSTVAFQLACALKRVGIQTGLLDADVQGPSQVWLLSKSRGQKIATLNGAEQLQPIVRADMPTLSMADLVDSDTALMWRGPMQSGALQHLVRAAWPPLDVLVMDLPPGTGDIHLSLLQKMPVTAAVVVTLPDMLSVLDTQKGILMLQRLNIPVLGLVENKAHWVCPHCHEESHLFPVESESPTPVEGLVRELGLHELGQLPWFPTLRASASESSECSKAFDELALKCLAQLEQLPLSKTAAFSDLKVNS